MSAITTIDQAINLYHEGATNPSSPAGQGKMKSAFESAWKLIGKMKDDTVQAAALAQKFLAECHKDDLKQSLISFCRITNNSMHLRELEEMAKKLPSQVAAKPQPQIAQKPISKPDLSKAQPKDKTTSKKRTEKDDSIEAPQAKRAKKDEAEKEKPKKPEPKALGAGSKEKDAEKPARKMFKAPRKAKPDAAFQAIPTKEKEVDVTVFQAKGDKLKEALSHAAECFTSHPDPKFKHMQTRFATWKQEIDQFVNNASARLKANPEQSKEIRSNLNARLVEHFRKCRAELALAQFHLAVLGVGEALFNTTIKAEIGNLDLGAIRDAIKARPEFPAEKLALWESLQKKLWDAYDKKSDKEARALMRLGELGGPELEDLCMGFNATSQTLYEFFQINKGHTDYIAKALGYSSYKQAENEYLIFGVCLGTSLHHAAEKLKQKEDKPMRPGQTGRFLQASVKLMEAFKEPPNIKEMREKLKALKSEFAKADTLRGKIAIGQKMAELLEEHGAPKNYRAHFLKEFNPQNPDKAYREKWVKWLEKANLIMEDGLTPLNRYVNGQLLKKLGIFYGQNLLDVKHLPSDEFINSFEMLPQKFEEHSGSHVVIYMNDRPDGNMRHAIYLSLQPPYELSDVNYPDFRFRTMDKDLFTFYLHIYFAVAPYRIVYEARQVTERELPPQMPVEEDLMFKAEYYERKGSKNE